MMCRSCAGYGQTAAGRGICTNRDSDFWNQEVQEDGKCLSYEEEQEDRIIEKEHLEGMSDQGI